jgi:hypothetical protein
LVSSGRGDVLIRTAVDPGPGSGFSVGTASASASDGNRAMAVSVLAPASATADGNGTGNSLLAFDGTATVENGDNTILALGSNIDAKNENAQVGANPLSPKSA